MLKTLVLARFQATFFRKPKDGKKPRSMALSIVLISLYLIFVFGNLFLENYRMFGDAFIGNGEFENLYFAIAAFTSMMLGFIGSVMMTQSQLYQAKDNELLLSMPIKPSVILASRIVVLYFWSFAFSAINLIPAAIIYLSRKPSSLALVMIIVEIITIPLFALTVSLLIAWILQLTTSRMKNKTIFNTVGALVLSGAYIVFCSRLYSIVSSVVDSADAVLAAFKTKMFPFYACGQAVVSGKTASVLLELAVTIIPFAIAYIILSKTFIKIATTKTKMAKYVYKREALKSSGMRQAIARKEIRRFVTSTTYMLNGAMGLVMMVLAAVYMAVKSDLIFGTAAEMFEGSISENVVVSAIIVLVASMGIIAEITVCSISLEGKNLWILKSAPIAIRDILMGKIDAHLIIALPFSVVTGIALNFMGHMNLFERIMALILPIAVQVFAAYFGLYINLLFPKFDWDTEAQAIKRSGAAFIVAFGGMGLIVLLTGLIIGLQSLVNVDLLLLIIAFLLIINILLIGKWLHSKGERRFQAL